MKKKVIFIYHHINSIGGVEMAMLRLAKQLHKHYDLYIGFGKEDSDFELLQRFSGYATVTNLTLDTRKYDVAVYCSLYVPCRVRADRYIRWVHGCVTDMGFKLKPEPSIEKYVAVGQTCADQLLEQLPNIDVEVIYNEQDDEILGKAIERIGRPPMGVLNLVTVSRISPEKGFERMLKISQQLKAANISYVWNIVGNGYNKSYQDKIKALAPKEWIFHGKQDNPFPYMKHADFLLQLSDYEAFGYVLQEALILGTPVITTDYLSASEMIRHGKNGYIIKKDLSDFTTAIFDHKPTFTYKVESGVKQWLDILK